MKSTINFKYYLFFIALFFSTASVFASWDDLNEDEKKVFGSEKESKYPINSFIIEKEDWEDHYSLMVFGLYKYTDYPKYTSLRILPFYYHLDSKIDDRKKTILFFPYPYYSYTENEEKFRVHLLGYSFTSPDSTDWSFLYLFYYGNDEQNNSSYNALFPVYKFSAEDSKDRKSMLFMTPFFYYNNEYIYDESGNPVSGKNTFASLLFYRSSFSNNSGNIADDKLNKRTMFPLIPVIYYNYQDSAMNSHSSFLAFFHWYKESESLYKISSPIISWEKNSHLIFWPLLSVNYDPENSFYNYMINPVFIYGKDSFFHILPLLSFNWNGDEDHFYETMWNPVFLYDKNNYFHIVPLLAFNWNGGEDHSYRNMWNPLFSWEKDKSFNLHPLLSFNHYGDDYTMIMNPLFIYYRNPDVRLSLFPVVPFLWYHKKDLKEKKDTYNFLTFFHFTNYDDSPAGNSFSPLHYYNRTDEKSLFLSPVFYNYSNYETGTGYRGFIPFYFSWHNSENRGSTLLPVYYTNHSKDKSVNINILGLASTYAAGPFKPVAGVDIGQLENTWYLDFTFSWLYNFFSVYYRLPLNREVDLYETTSIDDDIIIKDDQLESLQNTEAILSSENNSRSESLSFYGTDFFYGLFSYQKSDHMKHIRLLPLAWFTWYDNSDDKVNFVPAAYFYYKRDDLKYFLLFPLFIPLYGEQINGNSYTRSYGLILYWDIYKDEEKTHEKHILWPLFKSYSRPDTNGWYLFPFVWHNEFTSGNETNSRTVSTLLYYSSEKTYTDSDGNLLSNRYLNINPFLFYSSRKEKDAGVSSVFTFPVIPLYYRYRSDDVNSDRVLYNLFSYKRTLSEKSIDLFFSLYHDYTSSLENVKSHKNWTLPFYYYNHVYTDENDSKTFITLFNYYKKDDAELTINIPILPLFHYRKSRDGANLNIVGNLYSQNNNSIYSSKALLFGLYYNREYNSADTHLNWILPFYFNYENGNEKYNFYMLNLFYTYNSPEEKSFSVLWPLYYHNKSNKSSTNVLFPLVYSRITDNDSYHQNKFISPLFIMNRKEYSGNSGYSNFFSLPFLLQYSYYGTDGNGSDFKNGFFLGYYYNSHKDYRRYNFLYLFDYKNDNGNKSAGLLLNNISYASTPQYNEFKLSYGLLFDYKNYKQNSDYSLDMLTFLYQQYNVEGNFYSSVFPVYWYKQNEQYTRRVILPLLGYNYKDQDYLYNMYGLGLVWFHYADFANDYEKKLLFLGTLYDYTHKPLRDYTSYSQFWGLLWNYEYEESSDYKSFSILKFLYKRVRQNGKVKNKILGITVSEKNI
ncbi:MAG: hypothetical protein JW982_05810 [Spirochaetes bacterium]|nr:hypothetical protein [Spirochaetota bacterium]